MGRIARSWLEFAATQLRSKRTSEYQHCLVQNAVTRASDRPFESCRTCQEQPTLCQQRALIPRLPQSHKLLLGVNIEKAGLFPYYASSYLLKRVDYAVNRLQSFRMSLSMNLLNTAKIILSSGFARWEDCMKVNAFAFSSLGKARMLKSVQKSKYIS